MLWGEDVTVEYFCIEPDQDLSLNLNKSLNRTTNQFDKAGVTTGGSDVEQTRCQWIFHLYVFLMRQI